MPLWSLVIFAGVANRRGNDDVAARLIGAIERALSELGIVLSGVDAVVMEAVVDGVSLGLGTNYDKAVREGASMSFEEAAEVALAFDGRSTS